MRRLGRRTQRRGRTSSFSVRPAQKDKSREEQEYPGQLHAAWLLKEDARTGRAFPIYVKLFFFF